MILIVPPAVSSWFVFAPGPCTLNLCVLSAATPLQLIRFPHLMISPADWRTECIFSQQRYRRFPPLRNVNNVAHMLTNICPAHQVETGLSSFYLGRKINITQILPKLQPNITEYVQILQIKVPLFTRNGPSIPLQKYQNPSNLNQLIAWIYQRFATCCIMLLDFILQQVKQKKWQQKQQMTHVYTRDPSIWPATNLGGSSSDSGLFGFFGSWATKLLKNWSCNRAQWQDSVMQANKSSAMIIQSTPIYHVKSPFQSSCSKTVPKPIILNTFSISAIRQKPDHSITPK